MQPEVKGPALSCFKNLDPKRQEAIYPRYPSTTSQGVFLNPGLLGHENEFAVND